MECNDVLKLQDSIGNHLTLCRETENKKVHKVKAEPEKLLKRKSTSKKSRADSEEVVKQEA